MTLELYANYGCLASEKEVVYTYSSPNYSAVTSEKIKVKVPEGWDLEKAENGEYIVNSPWGWKYRVDELLCKDNKLAFVAYDNNHKMVVADLIPVEETE